MNAGRTDALAPITSRLLRCGKADRRPAGGIDPADRENIRRFDFKEVVDSAGGIRNAPVRAAGRARTMSPPNE